MEATLHINLFGGFGLAYAGEAVPEVNTERLQSLLAYLVLHRGAALTRQHIAFTFWPDSREKQAYNNLRNVLFRLRNALPDADRFLEVDTRSLRWRDDAPFDLDVAGFERYLKQAREARQQADPKAEMAALQEAANLYQGDLLVGLYDEWILPERERYRLSSAQAFDRLIHLLESRRDYASALHQAQRLLQYDALREPTYRLLMRLHALNRDRAGALRAYQQCLEVLKRELDLEPEPETQVLYRQIQNGKDLGASPPQVSEAKGHEIPLVGRHEEWKRLQQAWAAASGGQPQLLVVSGEAGIGKTRLVEELRDWVGNQGLAVAQARCYAAEGRPAYAPVVEWLRSESIQENRSELDDIWIEELKRLLPELQATQPEISPPKPLREGWEKQRFFEAMARGMLAGGRPLLLILDDMQWCDRETLEWLRFLLRFAPEAPLLVVGTVRAEESDGQPLQDLLLELGRNGQVETLMLPPLEPEETAQLAFQIAGIRLKDSLAAWLYRETEGNPLFVVESIRARLSSGDNGVEATAESLPVSSVQALPTRVQAVLTTRLSRLTPVARSLVTLAAATGRSFSVDVLAHASQMSEENVVEALDELWKARIIQEYSESNLDFTHDKLREVAYGELSPVRRRLLHRRIAEALEAVHASNLDAMSPQIAVHYERASLREQAVAFYERAAAVAARIGSHRDAARYYSRALDLLDDLPETAGRDAQKQALLISLGLALRLTEGHAAEVVGEVFEKARVLNEKVGGAPQRFAIQRGLWSFHLLRAEYAVARNRAEELLALAGGISDDALRLEALVALGLTTLWQGALIEACDYLEQGLELYDLEKHGAHVVRYGQDPGVASHALLAYATCLLGQWERSAGHLQAALSLAGELNHPFSMSYALQHAMLVAHGERRGKEALVQAEKLLQLSEERGYAYWLGPGMIGRGWALSEEGQPARGLASIREGLAAHRARGAGLSSTLWHGMLAEALMRAGNHAEALQLLDDTLDLAGKTGEGIWDAELYRMKGEALIEIDGEAGAAEACFLQAIETARRQRARTLELRALTSLSRLRRRQGLADQARADLQAVYDCFSEEFDMPDLIEARELLDSMA